MKTSRLLVAVAVCALSSVPLASAQDSAATAKPAMSMEMDAQMVQMHDKTTQMQSEMDAIRAATDPKERQKLMQAHMQTMQDSMATMRSMSKAMTADSHGGGMAMGGSKEMPAKGAPADMGMMSGNMMQRHQMMERRMEMLQTMIDQMLQHQQVMESTRAK